jgi:hypothetical protein
VSAHAGVEEEGVGYQRRASAEVLIHTSYAMILACTESASKLSFTVGNP